jgi:hypothetical protein
MVAIVLTKLFLIAYLTMLSISRLCSFDDGMINECGAVGRLRIGRGNRTWRKPAPAPLYPQQIVHVLTFD